MKIGLFEYVCYLNNWVELWLFGIGPKIMNKSNEEVLSIKPNKTILVSKGLEGNHN